MAHEKRQAVIGEVGNDMFGRESLEVLFDGPELGEGVWCPSDLVAHGVGEDVDGVIYVGIGIVQHAAEVSAKLMLEGVRQGGCYIRGGIAGVRRRRKSRWRRARG